MKRLPVRALYFLQAYHHANLILHPEAMMTGVQLLACDVQVQSIIVEVAVNTREPVSNYASQTEILWKNWTWPADLSLTDQLRTVSCFPRINHV